MLDRIALSRRIADIRIGPADVVRLILLVGAALLLGDGQGRAALEFTVAFGLALVPRALRLPRALDLGFALAMSLATWGNVFDLFERYGWYDTVVHFTLPAVAAPTGYLVLVRLGVLPQGTAREWARPYAGMALIVFLIGAGLEAVFEIYEFTVDGLTGSQLQMGNTDTVSDLAASSLGAFLGGQLLVAWWSSLAAALTPRHDEAG
jgi:hypothetical protein